MWKKEGLSILNFKLRINNKGERWDRLKQLIRLAYHLMLMHHLLPGWGLQEIEAAILAATAPAALGTFFTLKFELYDLSHLLSLLL